ncbi:MAG: PIN domain-containing protein [Chloroflexota bacterium]|nr:PIN domain-containing protein [Chloroflexota bacterium]
MSEPESAAFIDTSVVFRYLTNDPPAMAAVAARLIDSDQPLILSEVILAETAYVLSSVYDIPRVAVVDALSAFIQRRNIRLLNLSKPRALEALRLCRDSKRHSFADALLWAEASHSGIQRVFSFDDRFPAEGLESAELS